MEQRQMRPLTKRDAGPSLVARVLGLALAPLVYGMQLSSSAMSWGMKQATLAMQLPIRVMVTALQLADALICDLLVMLAKQPGLRSQVQACQGTISELQLVKQAQERQIALLQSELDSLKMDRSKAQRKTLELNQQLQRLQKRLSMSMDTGVAGAAAAAAAAAAAYDNSPTAASAAAAAGDGLKSPFAREGSLPEGQQYAATDKFAAANGGAYYHSQPPMPPPQGGGEYGQVPAKGWYLHACVIMAGLGVRWWLLNQTDPLQRKVMLVIIWPALWAYGGLMFKVFPNSYTLRASLACTCWALLGYVAHEMVSASVRGQ